MSLVLNTNDSGGNGYILSNEKLGIYPDFQNSAIIAPMRDGEQGITVLSTPQTLPAVKDVNGTRINGRAGNILSPDYYNTESGAESIITVSSNTAGDKDTIFRIGIPFALKGGEIIGKRIVGGFRGFQSYSTAGGYAMSMTFSYKVKLLHLDGTLTDVGTLTWTTGSQTTSAISVYFDYTSGRLKEVDGNGTLATEGDLIVVDLVANYTYAVNVSSALWKFFLGKKYTLTESNRMLPLEISID